MSISNKALDVDDIEYFNRGILENPRFWQRFGKTPNFVNSTVIDLGCGHGSLCIDIASSGAKKVIGLDLDARRIDFAKKNLLINYPNLANIIEFRLQKLEDAPEIDVDYIVSKDTFEHIINLSQVLSIMKEKLKVGGYIYAGIGPLWKSPFGDHNKSKMRIPWSPWGHVIFSEKYLINRLKRIYGYQISSFRDLGLNMLPLEEYLRIFNESQLSILLFKINAHEGLSKVSSLISIFMSILRKIPLLRDYCTTNIYCILEK